MTDTAKVKNVAGEDLLVPWLGGRLVLAGQAVEVPAEDVYAYTQQAETWAPYDNAAKKAHKDGSESRADDDTAAAALYEQRFGMQQPVVEPVTQVVIDPDTGVEVLAAQSVDAASPIDPSTGPGAIPDPETTGDTTGAETTTSTIDEGKS